MLQLELNLDVVDEKYNTDIGYPLLQGNSYDLVFDLKRFGEPYTYNDNTSKTLSARCYVVSNNKLDNRKSVTETTTTVTPELIYNDVLDVYELRLEVDTSTISEILRNPYHNSIIFYITETNTSTSENYSFYTSHFYYFVKPNPSSKIPIE